MIWFPFGFWNALEQGSDILWMQTAAIHSNQFSDKKAESNNHLN
jgi:hypothetical protein